MNVDGKAVQDNGQDTSPDTRSDLGLLFIHGIGRQRQGQTLTGWLDPLCDWMRNWLSGAARYATSCGVTKEELSAAFPLLDSEAKQLLDAARVPDKPKTIGRRGLNNADLAPARNPAWREWQFSETPRTGPVVRLPAWQLPCQCSHFGTQHVVNRR